MPIPILLIATLTLLQGKAPKDWYGTYRSEMNQDSSNVTGMCFLFQGFPDAVTGASFSYSDTLGVPLERYVRALIDTPKPIQKLLCENAELLASRLYTNEMGRRYLLINRADARQGIWEMWRFKGQKLAPRDQLMLRTLTTYFQLCLDKSEAAKLWLAAPKSKEEARVAKNVKSLLRTLVITNTLGKDWTHPAPVR